MLTKISETNGVLRQSGDVAGTLFDIPSRAYELVVEILGFHSRE